MDWKAALKYPLVYIEWSDPTSLDDWWKISDLEYRANTIRSCGRLLDENEKIITLILNEDREDDSVSLIQLIPKRLILRKMEIPLPES